MFVYRKKNQTYNYTGIFFSSSGTFLYCQDDLHKRGLKATFKISKCFDDLHADVDMMLYLCDHTLKPVLLYGSEILGPLIQQQSVYRNIF